jgi:hypothetical protein
MNQRLQRAESVSSREERRARGKSRRRAAPRHSHGDWRPASDRPDPIDLLQEQDKDRIRRLLPMKYGRMAESPLAFLRGSAVVMAADLANTSVSAIDTVLCGDAYLSNFGVFATPERHLAFDINDFDETYPGPTASGEFDVYWRQLKDMKGSFAIEALDEEGLEAYVALCS